MPAAKAQVGPDITAWLQNTTLTGYGGYTSNVQLVQYNGTYAYVTASCIPEYSIGPWPTDPNVPSPQNFVCEFPRTPVPNTGAAVYTGLGAIGLWTNGVAIFNAEDGFHWSSTSSSWAMGPATYTTGWNRNALVFEGASFDSCLGHPAPGGTYHNHVNPKCLYNDLDSTHHSPIIGFAFDGYPIYGCYGYASTTSASGPIRRMRSSYALTTDTVRSGGPSVSAYPLGDCCEDYIYTAGSGDLDDHNGRFCYTPDYPTGTYAYFVTLDSNLNPAFPLVIGPSYYGVVGSTSTHIVPTGTDTTYTGTTGIAAVNHIGYRVVPNPVDDYAYIYMDAASMNNVTGYLYDEAGRLVRTVPNMQPTIAYALNMTDLPTGIYVLSFEAGTVKVTERIVKK